MATVNFKIEGMSCDHCVAAVRKGLEGVSGLKSADVKIGSARVEYDPALASPAQFAEAVSDQGFDVDQT